MEKVILIYWSQKFINAPDLVKKCLLSWKLKNPTWKIIELNDDNLKEYIDIEKEIPNIHEKNITKAAYSDIVRIFLLAKYGGLWCDATTLCTKSLDDWLNEKASTGFFAFDQLTTDRTIASWFLYGEKNNYIIQKWKEKTIQYWKNNNEAHHYFWFHYLFTDLCNSDNKFKELWDSIFKFSGTIPSYFRIENTLKPLSETFVKHIDNFETPLYKLTYKYDAKKESKNSNLNYLLNRFSTDDSRSDIVNLNLEKVIFIYWSQKFINAPDLVKKCLLSWKLKNPTWKIIELNDDNLKEYIDIEKEIPNIHEKNITKAAYSDIVRIFLLAKYGGLWCDATTLCTKSLDDWLNEKASTGFFAFNWLGIKNPKHILASWFLYGEKNNYIIQKWKEKTIQYWKNNNEAHHYFWFHYLFGDLYYSDNKFKELWDSTSKILGYGPQYIQSQGLLNKLSDVVKKHVDNVKTPLYKLTYKYDAKKESKNSNLNYLLNKIDINDTGRFAIANSNLVKDIDSLLTIDRMDIIVNLIYCSFYDKKLKSTFARDLYINQKKYEKGNKLIEFKSEKYISNKSGEKEWIEKFNNLIDSVKNNKFIWHDNIRKVDMITIGEKSPHLIRGAHRVAAHYYFNKNIYATYDNEFKHIHHCKIENYDFIFNKFIELKKDTLVYVLFPKYNNIKNNEFIKKSINDDKYQNLLYSKRIKLNERGFIYFLITLYQIHDINGVGSLDFNVIRNKLLKSFDDKQDIVIYFVEKKCDRRHIINFKKNIIRKYISNKNNHFTFHVSDNHEETKNISRFVLNDNNIFFANNNHIDKFNINYPSLEDIKYTNINKKINVNEIVKDVYIKSDDYCVVGSKILSLFGIRKHKDVDIISNNLLKHNFDNGNKYFLKFLSLEPDEIIYNPNNHMYFFNVKCITPDLYLKFKIARFNKTKDNKDKLDIDNLKLLLKGAFRENPSYFLQEQFWRTVVDDSDNLMRKSVFYTAQTWKDNKPEEAIKLYSLYTKLKDTYIEEVYMSYLGIGDSMRKINKNEAKEIYSFKQIESTYLKGINLIVGRAEGYKFLGDYYMSRKMFSDAIRVYKSARSINYEDAAKKYKLFLTPRCYGFWLNDLMSVAYYRMGKKKEGLECIDLIYNHPECAHLKKHFDNNIKWLNKL